MEKRREDFYTNVHTEILSLIDFHIRLMEKQKKSGTSEPDLQEKINLMGGFKEMVYRNADNHLDIWKDNEIEKKAIMETRLKAECFECKKITMVTIIGQEKDEDLNILFDIVKCTLCGYEFRNQMPNNWNDRLIFSQHCIDALTEIPMNDQKMPEEIKKDIDKLISFYKNIVESQQKVLAAEAAAETAIKNADQNLEEVRDYLLMAKISSFNWNNPPAIN